LAVAVVVLVLSRQLRPRRISEGRWWILPAVLTIVAVKQGGWTDPHHEAASAALLVVELAIGAGMGTAWAFTTRIWRDDQGIAWAKGTKATAAAWIGGIALRVGLSVLGTTMGVHEGSGPLMLALAATLLIRMGVLVWRVRELEAAAPVAKAAF
jgi:hypothetical protein